MSKVVVFGKPGGGKSTLSRKLSAETGIKLCALDLIEYKKNGERVSPEEYSKKHADLIDADNWIIEGLGTLESFWLRIDAADTLIYVDLPYYVGYWWVTKRLLKSLFVKPEGWPEGCSVLKGTFAGWKYLRLSPKFWTPEFFEEIQLRGKGKDIYRITSVKEINNFARQFGSTDVRI
ncbi:adenylate kinase [Sulfuriflexus mobilis]|uniref:adenylate kinase n=1 Tax=Sulfuriflexus mobilis TaxID=1811807 RepID=UPI000F8224DA|nr:adenylate kinase [Sulfuriflexus mobilis]